MKMLRTAAIVALALASAFFAGHVQAQDTSVPAEPDSLDPAVLDKPPVAQVGIGIGYGTETGPAFSAYARTDGLLGKGHQLGVNLELGEDSGSFDANYQYGPLWGREDLTFALNLSGVAAQATDAFAFDTESIEVTPRLVYSLSDSVTLSPYVSRSNGRIHNLSPGSSLLITRDAGRRTTTAIGLDTAWQQGDEAAGYQTTVQGGVEFGDTDRGHEYTSLSFDARHDRLLDKEGNLQFSLDLTAGSIMTRAGTSHIGDRTILGQSVMRGFELAGIGPRDLMAPGSPALGGNSYAVVRMEMRAPNLFGSDNLRPVPGVFADAGSLWGLDDRAGGPAGADPVDDGFNMRASIGILVDVQTRIGTFQASLGQAVTKKDYDREAPFNLAYRMSF